MLNTVYDEGERPLERLTREEDCFAISLYFGCPHIGTASERLKAAHVECKPPQRVLCGSIHAFRTMSIRDPGRTQDYLQWPEGTPF